MGFLCSTMNPAQPPAPSPSHDTTCGMGGFRGLELFWKVIGVFGSKGFGFIYGGVWSFFDSVWGLV